MRYVSTEWSKLTLEQKNRYDIDAGDERAYQNQQWTEHRRRMNFEPEDGNDHHAFDAIETNRHHADFNST